MAARACLSFALVRRIPGIFFTGLLAIKTLQLQTRTKAAVTPAMLGVVGEHAWIRLRKTGATTRASAFDGKICLLKSRRHVGFKPLERPHHTHHALPMLQCAANSFAQGRLVLFAHQYIRNG